jgi:conjugal transfer pilus assembly protein TraW
VKSSSFIFSAVAAAILAAAMPTHAEELGVIGPVYPIGEESALDTILNKLKEKERSGELKKIQQAAIKRSVNSAKNPVPVDGLVTVQERKQRLIDPTVTYNKAVTTDEGQIVVPAGSKINPLLVTSLSKRLVFFDGRDKAQTEAVRRMVLKYSTKVKPILVAGSWYDTSKAWKTQVFYDQQGKLSKRFGIEAVPTVISQQGAMLLLEEVPAKELK